MKRTLSLLLVLAMLLSLSVTALAADAPIISLSTDKESYRAGDAVTLTVTVDKAMENLLSFEYWICFDNTVFELTGKSVGTACPAATMTASPKQYNGDIYRLKISNVDTVGEGFSVAAGTLCTLHFTVRETVTEEVGGGFYLLSKGAYEQGTTLKEIPVVLPQNEDAPLSIPVAPKAEEPATTYTVALSKDAELNVGEQATVSATVSGAVYNAIDMTLSYDTALLELLTEELEGLTLTVEEGSVNVKGYGADRADGSAAFTLSFEALAPGEALVELTSAKVDASAHAIDADAPEATLNPGSVKLTVGGYSVKLTEDFEGAAVAAAGEDYTFTAKDKNYDYDFTGSTMGGEAVTVKDNGDGSFTVENVSGELNIVAKKTPKSFAVSIDGSGKDDISGAATATYGTAYTFTLNKKDGYDYSVSVKIGGAAFTGYNVEVNTYTIPGADVTGSIEVSVTKTAQAATTTTITISGVSAEEVVGGLTQSADIGKDFRFKLNEKDGYDYTVKLDGEVLTPDGEGYYTVPAAKVVAGGVAVTVEKTLSEGAVNVSEYVRLDEKMMYLLLYANTPDAGKVPTYEGNAMYYSPVYKAWAVLVIAENGKAEDIKTAAAEKLSVATADKVELVYDGDVNKTALADINDAQLVWDMYNAKYADFETVSMEKFLRADVDGDGKLDTNDAVEIVGILNK